MNGNASRYKPRRQKPNGHTPGRYKPNVPKPSSTKPNGRVPGRYKYPVRP